MGHRLSVGRSVGSAAGHTDRWCGGGRLGCVTLLWSVAASASSAAAAAAVAAARLTAVVAAAAPLKLLSTLCGVRFSEPEHGTAAATRVV